MVSDSKEDGMKDEEKGKSDPIREFFDGNYKEGVDISKGIRDGEKAHRELDKHPISGPVVDAFLGGFDTMGKSKAYGRTHNRVKYGESPRKVFGDEIRKKDRSYSSRDSSTIHSAETGPISKLVKWIIGLWFVGVLLIGFINNPQNKQPRLETSVKRMYVNQTIQNRDKMIKKSLDDWISDNLNYPLERDIMGLEYPVKISLQNYSVVGKNIWASCYRHGYGGMGHLIYSEDGGENWEVLWRDNRTSLGNVYFFDDYKGVMATGSQILKSTNGGRGWEEILYVRNIDSLDVKNEDNISVRLRGGVNESIETNNGGRTWGHVIYHGRHYGSRSLKSITYNGGRSWERYIEDVAPSRARRPISIKPVP